MSGRSSLAGRLALVASLVVALALSTRAALGFVLAPVSPPLALRVAPTSAVARARAASVVIYTAQDRAGLIRGRQLATAALARSPTQAIALRDWGLVEVQLGNARRGERAIALAGRLTLRDYPTHAWLYDAAISRGDRIAAAREADIVLRQDTANFATFLPILATASTDAALRAAVVARLGLNPLWRDSYLLALASTAPLAAAWPVLEQAHGWSPPPAPQVYAPYFRRGAETLPAARLLAQWRRLAPPGNRDALLRNANFDAAEMPPPFGWQLYRPEGGDSAEVAMRPDRASRALHLSMVSAYAMLAAQGMALSPGRFRFSASVLSEGTSDGAAYRVRIVCGLDDRGVALADQDLPGTAGAWRRFALEFEVPPGCDGQRLWFGGRDGSVLERGGYWLDDLAVSPAG